MFIVTEIQNTESWCVFDFIPAANEWGSVGTSVIEFAMWTQIWSMKPNTVIPLWSDSWSADPHIDWLSLSVLLLGGGEIRNHLRVKTWI